MTVVDQTPTPTPPLVLGHSASCSLAWMAADARPERIAKVALIGAFPWADGQPYADFIPPRDGFPAFPGRENFEDRDKVDMDADMRSDLAANAIPVPEGVTKAPVHCSDERRDDVPEMAQVAHLDLVEIDSGHWPMITTPVELAKILNDASTS